MLSMVAGLPKSIDSNPKAAPNRGSSYFDFSVKGVALMTNSIEHLIVQNNFYHVFQPILVFPGKGIIGYEALIRSNTIMNPDLLFQHAMEQNKLFEVESFSIVQAMSSYFRFADSREHNLLFINVFPSTLVSPLFYDLLGTIVEQFEPYRKQIVFEINESLYESLLWKSASFRDAIRLLREREFMIALDDVGDGTTSFRNILDISPDFIKIDRFFASDLSISRKKQKVVALFAEYCNDETNLILEGLEKEEDFETALSLGIKMGQGYLFGKPTRLP
jgi:EAL domain-containing protein (putative c-di-GMP-specific phosphodiesterase class I)